jgi:hypothetical protein
VHDPRLFTLRARIRFYAKSNLTFFKHLNAKYQNFVMSKTIAELQSEIDILKAKRRNLPGKPTAPVDVAIIRESIRDSLSGYVNARRSDADIYPLITPSGKNVDMLAAPDIYALELRPLLSRSESAKEIMRCASTWEEDQPLATNAGAIMRAANSLGTLSGVLVAQKSLDLLRYEFPELDRVSINFSPESVNFNQAVTTRLRAIPSAGRYDPVAGYPDSDVKDSDVTLTVNQHGCVQIVYTANDLAATTRLLFPEQNEGMHQAIGLDMVQSLMALITPANFPGQAGDGSLGLPTSLAVPGTTVAALDQFARPTVIAMKAALNQRGATGGTRSLLLSEMYHAGLEGDTTIVGNLINVDSNRAITTGRLPVIAGFQPYESPYLPTTNNLAGFGFRADALAIVARLPNDYSKVFPGVTGGGIVETITNPDTGFSVMLVMFLDHKFGQTRMRLAYMFGTGPGNKLAGQLLTSQ